MNDSLVCRQLEIGDAGWFSFVQSHPQATLFHHPAWIKLLERCYGYQPFIMAAVDQGGEIASGIPFVAVNSILTGRRWVSLAFTDYCPVLSMDEGSLNFLSQHLLGLHQAQKSPDIEVRWALPAQNGIQSLSDFVIHELELSASPDALFKDFSKMHQRNIRKAETEKVTVRRSTSRDDLRVFYRLHLHTRRRLGVPIQPWHYFELLGEVIIEQGLGFLMLAYAGARPVSAALFFNFKDTVTYKYGASDEQYWALRPNNLLFWNALRWSCEQGYHIFNFGNSEVENQGLREFKRGWGAHETPLFRSYIGSEPGSRTSGVKEKLLTAVIRHSPEYVCRLIGELLYRHFG